VKPEAYEAYLKGRYFWNKRTGDGLKKAIEYFTVATEKDPNYAEAYAGLADSYALSGDWEYGILSPQDASLEAKAAATKALALDDTLGEAHTSRAFALDLYDWDWSSAEMEYRRAIALNPGYATAHHWYAWHLMVTGHTDEGILESRKAESLDPLSLIIRADLADALCIARRYDESVQQNERWKWIRISLWDIMNWDRPLYKNKCTMKLSRNFSEPLSLPATMRHSTPTSLMPTPSRGGAATR
jgi:tetratricopeptide (TPR) repeat protein